MLYDDFQIYGDGYFQDIHETTDRIRLPKQFPTRKNAEFEAGCFEKKEPGWEYIIRDYLR